MKQSCKNVFDRVYAKEPSSGLAARIEAYISAEVALRAQRKAYGFAIISGAALVAVIPAVYYVFGQVTQSGLYEYMSLFISDSAYAVNNLGEVGLSIIESVPVLGISYVLASLLIALYAARRAAVYIRSSRIWTSSLSL